MTQRTSEEWVATIRGDLGYTAQKAAYKDLWRYLYKVSYNFLHSSRAKSSFPRLNQMSLAQLAALAEDFAQETVAKLALHRLYDKYRGQGQFTSFMAMVANNEVRQALRRKEWSVPSESLPDSDTGDDLDGSRRLPRLQLTDDSLLEPDAEQELQEVWVTIEHCFEQMPERWREAFLCSVDEGLSTAEIKERLALSSEQVVFNLVHRARSRLKKCIAGAGWHLEDIWRLFK